jgi:hypothetical protein
MTAPYEPVHTAPAKGNVYDRRDFNGTVRFGTNSIATYVGKDLTITYPATGQVQIALPRAYSKRIKFVANWGKYAAGAVYFPVILTDNSNVESAPLVIIECRTEAGTATAPASGNELDFELSFSYDISNDAYDTNLTPVF